MSASAHDNLPGGCPIARAGLIRVARRLSLRAGFLPAERDLRILVLFSWLTDLKFVVTDPALATIGVQRPFDPGDRNQVRPERIGPVMSSHTCRAG